MTYLSHLWAGTALRGVKAGLTIGLAGAAFAAPAIAQDVSVPHGAPKEAYIEALADMEPVELIMQSQGSPGDSSSIPLERYAAAVEEYSGGKIVPEVVYGAAIIRGAMQAAIADGRLGYASVIAQYDPSNFPVGSALIDMTHVVNGQVLAGTLHSWGVMMDTGNHTPEAWEEQRNYGVEPGYTINGAIASGFFCREPRTEPADFAGIQIRAGGVVHGTEVQGLGAAAVALPFNEIYEGLQRGIVECALTNITTADVVGILPLAPYHVVNDAGGFGQTNTNNAFDQVLWEDIPLAARQLLYDLQTVFIKETIVAAFDSLVGSLQEITDSGGEVVQLSDASEEMLQATNAALLEESRTSSVFNDPEDVVNRLMANVDKWEAIIAELGYAELDPGWNNFIEFWSPDAVDFDPFIDRLYQEAMLPFRPQ